MEKYAIKTRLFVGTLFMAAVAMMLLPACAGMQTVQRRPAPDFKVELVKGGEATLSQFAGKPLVLFVGASWCPHCIHELPELVETHKKYGDRVGILFVFIKSEADAVNELIVEHKIDFMVAMDKESATAKAYGVKGLPASFFINANGVIVDEYLGSMTSSKLEEKINRMMGEGMGGK